MYLSILKAIQIQDVTTVTGGYAVICPAFYAQWAKLLVRGLCKYELFTDRKTKDHSFSMDYRERGSQVILLMDPLLSFSKYLPPP